MNRDGEDFEPLGAVEQAMLDGWLKVEGPQGCHWVDIPLPVRVFMCLAFSWRERHLFDGEWWQR